MLALQRLPLSPPGMNPGRTRTSIPFTHLPDNSVPPRGTRVPSSTYFTTSAYVPESHLYLTTSSPTMVAHIASLMASSRCLFSWCIPDAPFRGRTRTYTNQHYRPPIKLCQILFHPSVRSDGDRRIRCTRTCIRLSYISRLGGIEPLPRGFTSRSLPIGQSLGLQDAGLNIPQSAFQPGH